MQEIERTHRRLDTLERVHEQGRHLGEERVQEMERQVLDGSTRDVRQVERQVEQVQERVRSRDRGMDMGY